MQTDPIAYPEADFNDNLAPVLDDATFDGDATTSIGTRSSADLPIAGVAGT